MNNRIRLMKVAISSILIICLIFSIFACGDSGKKEFEEKLKKSQQEVINYKIKYAYTIGIGISLVLIGLIIGIVLGSKTRRDYVKQQCDNKGIKLGKNDE